MNPKSLLIIAFMLLNISFYSAQNTYDIVFPGNDRAQKCQQCFNIFRQKPKEVQFSIKREKDNLYFQVNNKEWFNLLFNNSGDGIAIDIVLKNRYDCDKESIDRTQIKGYLLKPVYAQKLKSGLRSSDGELLRVHVGKIPEGFLNDELEFNILFLNNKNLCQYYTIYDLETYPWELLDMGMFLDSITYNPKEVKSTIKENFVLRNKILKFKIPFKKNKSNYSPVDIKPIYDSLRLTDYNIKRIDIKAYSSIEGRQDRNIELQELRVKSIVSALQSFQGPTITTEVSSSENWVEFFTDIKGTKYESLGAFTKREVKSKIAGTISREMEPILSHHRKAVLELELERKDKYKEETVDNLLSKFNESIVNEDLKVANEIQNSIFEKLKRKESSPTVLRKMNIPKQVKFAKIFNKNSAYRYMLNVRQAMIVYNELLDLEKLVPHDGEVKYNIAAVKLKLWRFKALDVDEIKLKAQINALRNYKIDSSLISRMMVNFHIIKAENLMRARDYVNKDKSVSYINSNYKKFSLSNYDYLSLAQFFSYYADTDLSVKLLEDKARSIDIDENLLFYYLNLTMVNIDITGDLNYRTIMLNAINMNKKRFCKLFNSIEKGGVTFQLLEDDYLRETYCENCNE